MPCPSAQLDFIYICDIWLLRQGQEQKTQHGRAWDKLECGESHSKFDLNIWKTFFFFSHEGVCQQLEQVVQIDCRVSIPGDRTQLDTALMEVPSLPLGGVNLQSCLQPISYSLILNFFFQNKISLTLKSDGQLLSVTPFCSMGWVAMQMTTCGCSSSWVY